MNKRIASIVGVVALAGAIITGGALLYNSTDDAVAAGNGTTAAACTETGGGQGYGGGNGQGAGGGQNGAGGTHETHVASDPSRPLSTADAQSLRYMREEEKLAGDVYAALSETWNLRVFSTIARSEDKHTESIRSLLEIYAVADPAAGKAAGEFASDELQELYNDLMAQGGTSQLDAVKVGIAIEERDIADLKARIAATDREDLASVYGNLLRGSENHLRAFNRQLDRLGG